jgi:hypothetical protein
MEDEKITFHYLSRRHGAHRDQGGGNRANLRLRRRFAARLSITEEEMVTPGVSITIFSFPLTFTVF